MTLDMAREIIALSELDKYATLDVDQEVIHARFFLEGWEAAARKCMGIVSDYPDLTMDALAHLRYQIEGLYQANEESTSEAKRDEEKL